MILTRSVVQQGCTNVPDPNRPPFIQGQSNVSLPAKLLTPFAETQASHATDVEKLPSITQLPVLESLNEDQDDLLGF